MGATPTAAASVPSDVQRVTVRCCTLHALPHFYPPALLSRAYVVGRDVGTVADRSGA